MLISFTMRHGRTCFINESNVYLININTKCRETTGSRQRVNQDTSKTRSSHIQEHLSILKKLPDPNRWKILAFDRVAPLVSNPWCCRRTI